MNRALLFSVLLLFSLRCVGLAQFTNKSSVLDGSGTLSSGGGFTNISASGQPGGIAQSQGGTFVNQAGFLNTFFMRPGLDSDADGLANEADPDNDNDALADTTEIGGTAFNPVTVTAVNDADSDDDRMSDGQESVSGTDPNNVNAVFAIRAFTNASGARNIAWIGRGNNQKSYTVKTTMAANQPYNTVIFSNTLPGGTAPWFVVTNSVADSTATDKEFFAVEVYP